MAEFDFAVFIARLQPPHHAHICVIERALKLADRVIIILGSYRSAPDIRNPWSVDEREEMVRSCFGKNDNARLAFVPVRDQRYNDTNWIAAVHRAVTSTVESVESVGEPRVALVGHMKDRTSYYLEFFPQWKFVDLHHVEETMSATDVRSLYFSDGPGPLLWKDKDWRNMLRQSVREFLIEWRKTPEFATLQEQWRYIDTYKKSWETVPYRPTFTTTDAVVVKNGHILLVRRGHNPGKGLLALPGGFLDQDHTMLDCCLRELKEETRIAVDQRVLRDLVKTSRVFDHPDRSARGRTITHAFFIKLPDGGVLPHVKGDSDADGALWLPLGDLHRHEEEFFEDHLDIIDTFLTVT